MNQDDIQAATQRIMEVKQAHEEELLAKSNVVGVGIGFRRVSGELTGTPALVVMVSQKLPPAMLDEDDRIPNWIEGVPVDVQEVGQITAQ
jgi:hypothetical protein